MSIRLKTSVNIFVFTCCTCSGTGTAYRDSVTSVADPKRFDLDPDPAFHFSGPETDPNPNL